MSKHPQQITTADTALDDDMKSRIVKYSITMGIRTLCFVAAYFAFISSLQVLMWILVAGAVLLPYPAVIFANAGRERTTDAPSTLLDAAPLAELPVATGETVSGETISGDNVSPDAEDAGAEETGAAQAAPDDASDTGADGDTGNMDRGPGRTRGEGS